MGLPTLTTPIYEVKLVSVPKPVRYRPYLVKEEKLLLMAKQSDDPADEERAVKQLISACTMGAVDPEKLATFDLEYLFLLLRAKSVNDVVEIQYECKAPYEQSADKVCHGIVPVTVNLNDVKLHVPEGHTNKIMLTKDIGVTLKYPTAKHYGALIGDGADVVPLLVDCLETVFTTTGDITEIAEQSRADVEAFVESLTIPQIELLRDFFRTMPSLSYTIKFKCVRCGYEEDLVLSGLSDFFD